MAPAMEVDLPSPPKMKRKAASKSKDSDSDSEGATSDVEMLDVEFDFFDPQSHDYHSIKILLTQLLSHDSKNLDMGAVTDLILKQKLVGSTVKTDGAEGDPYAVLTVLNLNVLKDDPAIAPLMSYLLNKSTPNSALHTLLSTLFSNDSSPTASTSASPTHIGLVLSERLVNMPVQVVVPMFRMLEEELEWAREESEPYHFSHLLFLSRVFLSSTSELEEDPNASLTHEAPISGEKKKVGKKKKNKKSHESSGAKGEEQVWMYHPEDEYIAQASLHTQTFSYTSSPTPNLEGRAADSFGVETRGQMMLLEWGKFKGLVEGLEGFVMGGLA